MKFIPLFMTYSMACHPERSEGSPFISKKFVQYQRLMKEFPTVQVSDTRDVDSSTKAGNPNQPPSI
jgi:hypothetical protein